MPYQKLDSANIEAAILWLLQNGPRAVVMTCVTSTQEWVLMYCVSRDMSQPGMWRATGFSPHGPSGHDEAPTFEAALRAAVKCGADPTTAVDVTASTVDAVLDVCGMVTAYNTP